MYVLIHDRRIAIPEGWDVVSPSAGFVQKGDRVLESFDGPTWWDVTDNVVGKIASHFDVVIRRTPSGEG